MKSCAISKRPVFKIAYRLVALRGSLRQLIDGPGLDEGAEIILEGFSSMGSCPKRMTLVRLRCLEATSAKELCRDIVLMSVQV